ncbi:TIGR04219 family outer membrane beta-barrel protein [uncultured Psychromonas sp.]|uniref:TIGR04219 family outer membrane beta-barrel protein n=1 Tax=uncultured Psychromonas sp. TaxID=173974 RepID=UPI002636E887|nr:TIGR04219 family outer membrane beta-barrel protein [uncultured Psychromonas sp.]
MKKQVLAAAIAATMSMPAMADFLGVYAGLDYSTNDTTLGNSSDKSNNISGYIAFEHFIPLIPNVKLKYNNLTNHHFDEDESSTKNGILYYEILDNDLVELDLGAVYTEAEGYNESANLVQAYGAAKVHVPGVSMHAFAEVIAGSVTSDDVLSGEIGLAYTFNPDSSLLNIAVRTGYRVQELDLNHTSNKQEIDGLFAGVEVHF